MRIFNTLTLGVCLVGTALAQGLPDITKYVGGHSNSVFGIAYSPDATSIATSQLGGPINIFNAATGDLNRIIPGGGTQLAFSPDSERLIAGDATGFTVFAADTGEQLKRVTIPNPWTTNVRAGAIALDGNSAAAFVSDGTAIVWNLVSGESKHTFTTPGHIPSAATFTSNGLAVAAGTTGGRVVLYDPADGSVIRNFVAHTGWVNTLHVQGNVFVSGGGDAKVKSWNADTGTLIKQFNGHNGSVFAARMSPDSQYVLSGGMNGQFFLWKANTGGILCALWNQQGAVRAVAFSPDSERLVGGDEYRNVNHWQIMGLIILDSLSNHKGSIDEVAMSTDGRTIASASRDGTAKLWRNGQFLRTLPFGPEIYSADISPNSQYIALGGGIMTFIYDIETGAQLGSTFHGGVSMGAEFSRDSQYVFSSCTGHELKRVALNGAQSWLIHLDGPVLYVAVPPSGNTVAAATLHSNQSQVWTVINIVNSDTGQVLRSWTGYTDYIRGMEFAPGGSLVTAYFDGTIRGWNPDTGAQLWTRDTPGGIESMALSRVGDVVMTGEHGNIRFFRTSDGVQIRNFDQQIPNAVNSVTFSADERSFVYGLDTGSFAVANNPLAAGVEVANLVRGRVVSGGPESLHLRDGQHWRFRPGPTLHSSQAPVELTLQGTSPSTSASRLTINAVLGASVAGLLQKVEMFDFQANAWEVVDSRNSITTDQMVSVHLSNASRFVNQASREVRARITWKQQGPVLSYPWETRIDQAFWIVVP